MPLNCYQKKLSILILLLPFASCTSVPQGYSKSEKPETFSILEKVILKKCRLEEGGGHFSGVLHASTVPDLPIDGIWSKKLNNKMNFHAEISSPLGEPLATISVPQNSHSQAPEFSQNQTDENLGQFFLVMNTIGPENLRALICGHHLVANSDKILKANDSPHNFLLQSGLKSLRGTISISTVTTLPAKSQGIVRGSSLLTTGLFGTDELGRIEWEGVLKNSAILPKSIVYFGPTQKFKLFFSDFE
jgi:hypothetical protein